MNTEPTRLVSLINAAIAATIGILTVTSVVTEVVGGALILALGAWVAVVGEFVRSRVTPVESPELTISQYAKTTVVPD